MATIGTVLIVVGGLALLGGLGYVGYAYMEQEDNKEGMITNPEEGQDNKALAKRGMYIAGAGLVVALIGVGLTIGGRRGAHAA